MKVAGQSQSYAWLFVWLMCFFTDLNLSCSSTHSFDLILIRFYLWSSEEARNEICFYIFFWILNIWILKLCQHFGTFLRTSLKIFFFTEFLFGWLNGLKRLSYKNWWYSASKYIVERNSAGARTKLPPPEITRVNVLKRYLRAF